MIALAIWILAVLSPIEVGLASVYGLGEKWSGDVTASGQPVGIGIAHRTLPLGTRVVVCRLDRLRCYRTRVWDSGPFGTVRIDGQPGWQVAPKDGRTRRPAPGWRFRGIADLSVEVATALGYRDGLRPVLVVPW